MSKSARSRYKIKAVCICLLTLVACLSSFADVIYLKNGNKLEGEIIEETNELVMLKMNIGTMGVKREQIERIEKKEVDDKLVLTEKELYQKMSREIENTDIIGRLELANKCLEKKLYNETVSELRKASKLSPSLNKILQLCLSKVYNLQAEREYNDGIDKMVAGSYRDAAKKFKKVINKYPRSSFSKSARRIRQYCLSSRSIGTSVRRTITDSAPLVDSTGHLTPEETSKQLMRHSNNKIRLEYLKEKGSPLYSTAIRQYLIAIGFKEKLETASRARIPNLQKKIKEYTKKAREAKEKADVNLQHRRLTK